MSGQDTVFITTGNLTLAMTREEFDRARQRGAELLQGDAKAAQAAPDSTEPRLLDVKALALQLSLPRSTIYELRKAGKIPAIQCGRHLRFDLVAVRAALNGAGKTDHVSVGRG
jgi:excisionase family DNA binding protein